MGHIGRAHGLLGVLSTPPPVPNVKLQTLLRQPAVYVGPKDANSGPHVCEASTSRTEPSPQPPFQPLEECQEWTQADNLTAC